MNKKSKKNLNTLNLGQASNYKYESMVLKMDLVELSKRLSFVKSDIKDCDKSGLSTRELAYKKKLITTEIVKITEKLRDLKSKSRNSVSNDIDAIKNFFKERNK